MSREITFVNSEIVFWLVVGVFSIWGGFVRYLMDNNSDSATFSMMAVLKQIVISGFTGFIGGLYSYESKQSISMILITVSLSSTLGGTLLRWLWDRIMNNSTYHQ